MLPRNVPPYLRELYLALKAKNLSLDMTRGKPSPEQLALSDPLLGITEKNSAYKVDCRNYGELLGLTETRQLMAQYLGTQPEETVIGGNSSLALMHDIMVQGRLRGMPRSGGVRNFNTSVYSETPPTMLCPSPGYDRHFAICQALGIEMRVVKMESDGPNMDEVREYVIDPAVVGIWCVPKYSNPTGVTYSYKKVCALASMETANPSFRIFWDNAYAMHDLQDPGDHLHNIMHECRAQGHADRVFIFGSTSKITFAGGGISAVAMSHNNLEWYKKGLQAQTIGHDKLNQLRHTLFLRNMEGIQDHMRKHAEILAPKFKLVTEILQKNLGGTGTVTWSKPRGGYFINLDVNHGCAKRVVELAGNIGLKLTPAGATFPYGIDPEDRNIRIAPSFPSLEQLELATQALCLCIQIADLED